MFVGRGSKCYTCYMIFKMISIYHQVKEGTSDPAGFVTSQIIGAMIGAAIVPALVLLGVVVILGILSFTHLIVAPSLIAKILFWIFVIAEAIYFFIVFVIIRLTKKIINKTKSSIETTYYEIN